jgi:hypothetical protein
MDNKIHLKYESPEYVETYRSKCCVLFLPESCDMIHWHKLLGKYKTFFATFFYLRTKFLSSLSTICNSNWCAWNLKLSCMYGFKFYTHSFRNCLLYWIKYWLLVMRLRRIRWWIEPDFYMSAYESATGAWYVLFFSRKKHY